MHDEELDYRLEQMEIGPESPARGHTLRETALHERTGILLLALRRPDGQFLADPDPSTSIEPGSVLITLGTPEQLTEARRLAASVGLPGGWRGPRPD
jgi:voltage-gated potassium channel